MAETSDDFQKWLAWARANTTLFVQISTDGGMSWGYQSDPVKVAREAWNAATEHATTEHATRTNTWAKTQGMQ